MDEAVREKINQLSALEQNNQYISSQKNEFGSQLIEVESALGELKGKKECYMILGNIMVKKSAKSAEEELKEKKEMLRIRINSIEKQQEKAREKTEEIQNQIMSMLEKK